MEALLQTEILQQKKLNTLNSLDNCKSAGGEKSLLSFSQPFLEQSKLLYNPLKDWDFFFRLAQLSRRLEKCKEGRYMALVCDNCGRVVDPLAVRQNCFIRYCKNPNCIRARITRAKLRLHNHKIYSKRLLHLEIGFPYTNPSQFRKEKQSQEKQMRVFYKECKKLGIEIKGLRVFDFMEKQGVYFTHYHHAILPISIASKDYRKFIRLLQTARTTTIQKTDRDFIVRCFGWRKKRGLFSYMAKRMAGEYGDSSRGNQFYLPDIISPKEYLTQFHKLRSFVVISKIPSRRLGNVQILFLSLPKICPFCKSDNIKLISGNRIESWFADWKPPNLTDLQKEALLIRENNPKIKELWEKSHQEQEKEQLFNNLHLKISQNPTLP
jgi:hypothetical protein